MSAVIPTLESLLTTQQVVGRERLDASLAYTLGQTTQAESLPEAVVYPNSEAELAEVMACAHRHQWRVLPFGCGSKLAWGGLAPAFDLAISTQNLNQVVEHAVGDMTLTAAAGLKLADLKPQLAQHNQFLAIDPAYPACATLGGIVSTADTGSLRQRYNSVRDMLIGISFVRHDGQVTKAGGRVVKNVAGYDLMKLMTGAYGSLGIISQVTFRLYPIPETSTTLVISGAAAAIANLTADLRQSSLTPVALDILSPHLSAMLGFAESFSLAVRFQTNRPGVDEQVTLLSKLVPEDLSIQQLAATADEEFWSRAGRCLFPSSRAGGGADGEGTAMAKLGVWPAHAVDLLQTIHRQIPTGLARFHAGSGIGTLSFPAEMASPAVLNTLRQECEAARGYLTVLQAPRTLKQSLDIWGYQGNALPLMRRIKETFDPDQRLSGGRFVGGL